MHDGVNTVPGMNNTILSAVDTGQKRAWDQSLRTVYFSSLAFGGVALIVGYFADDAEKSLTDFVNKKVDSAETRDRDSDTEKVQPRDAKESLRSPRRNLEYIEVIEEEI